MKVRIRTESWSDEVLMDLGAGTVVTANTLSTAIEFCKRAGLEYKIEQS